MASANLGQLAAGLALPLTILAVIVLVVMHLYRSGKGMCRWTQDDGFLMTNLKGIFNSMTFGVPGHLAYYKKRTSTLPVAAPVAAPVGVPGTMPGAVPIAG